MRNVFVEHRNGITPVAALRGHLDWLANNYARPNELAIASGCFRQAIRVPFATRGPGPSGPAWRCACGTWRPHDFARARIIHGPGVLFAHCSIPTRSVSEIK